jgi:hypothetical protein
MITVQDCIAICGLDEAEVLAIAEHEHVPDPEQLLCRSPG